MCEVRYVPISHETVRLACFEVLAALGRNIAFFCDVTLHQLVISITDVSTQRSVLQNVVNGQGPQKMTQRCLETSAADFALRNVMSYWNVQLRLHGMKPWFLNAVYCESHKKHVNTLCGQMSEWVELVRSRSNHCDNAPVFPGSACVGAYLP